jgi:uncharacterized protein (DUF983 family)
MATASKRSEFKSFIQGKCPRCRNGKVFNGPAYSFRIQKMNENCPACQLKFEREPGYFYVAMFVSYALNIVQMVLVGIASYKFGLALTYENLWHYLGVLLASTILFAPFNFRYSRIILLYWLTPGLHYTQDH